MIEFLLASWLWIATWPFLVGFLLIGVWGEYCGHHKFAAFTTILAGLAIWKMFDVDPQHTMYAAIAYIPIGMIWSVWRWKVYCKRTTQRTLQSLNDDWGVTSPKDLEEQLNITRNLDRLVSWVICWPISMIERAIGDLIHMIKIMITEWFGNVYKSIASNSVSEYQKAYLAKQELDNRRKSYNDIDEDI